VLFTRADIPKITKPLPGSFPTTSSPRSCGPWTSCPTPTSGPRLIVARWSGARRDEIRRLAIDCLDTYPDGRPRLRIPVGKGHAERMILLHPQAAEALQPVIGLARRQQARPRFDPSAGRTVQHVLVRGKLLSNAFLFDLSIAAACTAARLVDSAVKPTISAHRFRHTIGTQLAEGGARLQTIMAVLGHRTPNMAFIYASLSDPTVKQRYQDALDHHIGPDVTLGRPAADALREHRLDPDAVSWLQTNLLETELELATAYAPPPKARTSATSCSPARSSSPPASTHPGCAPASPSSSSSSTTP
jgi:integrase